MVGFIMEFGIKGMLIVIYFGGVFLNVLVRLVCVLIGKEVKFCWVNVVFFVVVIWFFIFFIRYRFLGFCDFVFKVVMWEKKLWFFWIDSLDKFCRVYKNSFVKVG